MIYQGQIQRSGSRLTVLLFSLAISALLFIGWAKPLLAQEVPAFTGLVVDQAQVISAKQRTEIDRKLSELQSQTGSQLAVLTLSNLPTNTTLEEYAFKVASAWHLGRKGIDDGALLLVVPSQRELRIEVGRALEGSLSDLIAYRIIDQRILPLFRAGQLGDGIEAGVDAMIKVVRGEELPPSAEGAAQLDGEPLAVFLMFASVILGSVLVSARVSRVGSAIAAGLFGFMGGLIFIALLPALIISILTIVITLFGGKSGRGFGGPFGGGGFSIGGRSGGGFGGGGGGMFSGGGASGRW